MPIKIIRPTNNYVILDRVGITYSEVSIKKKKTKKSTDNLTSVVYVTCVRFIILIQFINIILFFLL